MIIRQPNPNEIPRYCNISTFARLPQPFQVEKVDIGILGIPFDGGCSFRTGARFGPEAIRKASRLLREYNPDNDIYPFKDKQVCDLGDIICTPYDNKKACDQIYDNIIKDYNNVNNLVFLGGDHTISYPVLKVMNEKFGQIALIHFDSHLDTWEEYFDEKYTHGTPFRNVINEKLIDVDSSIHVGIRGSINSKNDIENDAELGYKIIKCNEIEEIGIKGVIEKIKNRVKDKLCYISIDIDVLDPAFAPGTGTPECGGYSSRELISILQGLKDLNIVGGDIVEVAPCYDNNGDTTSLIAAKLSYELICLINKMSS